VFSKEALVSYTSLVAFILMAFAIGLFLGFGEQEAEFNTLNQTLLSLAELLFGNFDSRPIQAASGLLVSTLLLAFFAFLSMLSVSAILAVVSWGSRQVSEGLVQRESDDAEKNLKRRLSQILSEALQSPLLSFISRSFVQSYIAPATAQQDTDYGEDAAELEALEQAQALYDSKERMRMLGAHVNKLEHSMRRLHVEFGLEFNEDLHEWKRDNAWRKIRNWQQEERFQRVLVLLRTGDVARVERTLNGWAKMRALFGGDVEWRDPDGFSVLHMAALAGDPDMVQMLLGQRADPSGRNDDGNTPLHLAALSGQLNACRVLVEEGGADPEAANNPRFNALHMAAYGGHVPVVKYLAEELEVSVLSANEEGLTPLHLAVLQGHQPAAAYLSSHFPSTLEARANGGESALHCAVLSHQPESMVRLLLSAGCKVSTKMYDGHNVYQCALLKDTAPAVTRLLLTVRPLPADRRRLFQATAQRVDDLSLGAEMNRPLGGCSKRSTPPPPSPPPDPPGASPRFGRRCCAWATTTSARSPRSMRARRGCRSSSWRRAGCSRSSRSCWRRTQTSTACSPAGEPPCTPR